MGGKRYSVLARTRAVEAYNWEHHDTHAAIAMLRKLLPTELAGHSDHQLTDMMKEWASKFSNTGTVVSAKPPGQQPKMSDAEADECIRLLFLGYKKGRGHRWFNSVRHALQHCTALKQLADKYGYNHRSLLRRLKYRDPTLHRRTLRYIKRLKPSARTQRLAYCRRLLAMGRQRLEQYLARVVWLDSKKMYVMPKAHMVYAPRGATREGNLLVADDRLPGSSFEFKKVVYYAAVNSVLGACHFKICSGTTDYKNLCQEWQDPGLTTYKVGWALCTRASNA
jgi:hypothetical protein